MVASRYSGPLRDWILAFKHGGRRDLAEPLGRYLAHRFLGEFDPSAESPLLVPVPQHPLRGLERGYDHVRALTRVLAEQVQVGWSAKLRRRRHTPPQGTPGSVSRRANLRAAIVGKRWSSLAGRTVWLVDDVVTSGATLAACARAARRLGAREVCGLALARAALDSSPRAASGREPRSPFQ